MAVKIPEGSSAVSDATSTSGPSSPKGVTNKTTALPNGGNMPKKGGASKSVFRKS